MTGASPSFNYNFSSLCGTGPIYVVFANNTSTAGRFKNKSACTSGCTRTLTANFGSGCSQSVTYDYTLLANGADGDYVAVSPSGTVSYHSNGTCTPTQLLPLEWTEFTGIRTESGSVSLNWSATGFPTDAQINIQRQNPAAPEENFQTIATAVTTTSFTDITAPATLLRYRLTVRDLSGQTYFSPVIEIGEDPTAWNVVFPSPADSRNLPTLTFTGAPVSEVALTLISPTGISLPVQTGNIASLNASFRALSGTIAPGLWLLNFRETATGKTRTIRLMVY
jgi:hypothetical protein